MEIKIQEKLSYTEYLDWLDQASRKTFEDGQSRVMICSHPNVFTMGRGDRQNKDLGLKSDTESVEVIKVNRGGGLTFHGENQVILYPVMKLTKDYTLDDHLCLLAKTFQNVFKNELELEYKRNPLGLWHQGKKLASIGIELKRFVTRHGIAFNLHHIPIELNVLEKLNPCGLSASTYTSLQDIGFDHSWKTCAENVATELQALVKTKFQHC